MKNVRRSELGAIHHGDGRTDFRVWAPNASRVEVWLHGPAEQVIVMERGDRGYCEAEAAGAPPGSLYTYVLDGERERPDPASRYQPFGVHGCSQVVDSKFPWSDGEWIGLALRDYIFYELHVGTFTPEGRFDAVIPQLDALVDLGVTAVELMPVAQFPGSRNWGYDGACPYAVQNSYGGPEGLKRLVNACHQRGLAVALDVVYNHLGPEGNYLGDFGPYFSRAYRTPWGPALNFDGAGSDEVRRFFLDNALYWITEFHIDALRLDAVHAIIDTSARPFLEELGEAVHRRGEELGRRVSVIAESDLNDPRLVRGKEIGGYGLDAQWSDDFHHALHALLTAERFGYYEDFGRVQDLAQGFREGFVYSGQYSPFRQRRHGAPSRDVPAGQFVVFAQNHDQVGNRARGERLSCLVGFEELKLAAAVVMLSPFVPLLFMGEEYGETAPFLYFVSHGDEAVIEAVRRGRREEFAGFQWDGEVPDPQSEETFRHSTLHHEWRGQGKHGVLLGYHRELIRLRRSMPALTSLSKDEMETIGFEKEKVLYVRRWNGQHEAWMAAGFSNTLQQVDLPTPQGHWNKRLDSAAEIWEGGGSTVEEAIDSEGRFTIQMTPKSVVLFERAQS